MPETILVYICRWQDFSAGGVLAELVGRAMLAALKTAQ